MRETATEVLKHSASVEENYDVQYVYDNLNRIETEDAVCTTAGHEGDYTTAYTYDLVGNRMTRTVTVQTSSALLYTEYEYDDQDRLLRETHADQLPVTMIQHEDGPFYAYVNNNGLYYTVAGGSGRIGQFKAFFMGLPSVWSRYLFIAVLVLLPVFFFAPLLTSIWAKLRKTEEKHSVRLSLYHRCMCVLLAYMMLLSPGVLESIAHGDTLYTSLTSAAWGQDDKYIEYGYWDGANFVPGYDANGSLLLKVTRLNSDDSIVEVTRYEYNLQNRLARVYSDNVAKTPANPADDTLVTEYFYNNAGIRVRKIDYSTSKTTIYLTDPSNHTGYAQVFEETVFSGTDIDPAADAPDSRMQYTIGDDVISQTYSTYNSETSTWDADEILVVSPFMNPWCIAKEHNPIENPDQYKVEALKLVFFAVQMFPWVEAGIVQLVPDPGDFDYQLRINTWQMAQERLKNSIPTDEDMAEELNRGEQEFKRAWLSSPDEYFVRTMREREPHVSEEEIEGFLKYIRSLRQKDPFILEQSLDQSGPQLNFVRSGANLEMALYLCQMTGAFPYTNMKFRWKELHSVREELPPDSQIWTPLTQAFQGLDFKFLNRVDTAFACDIRKEGRLEGFRAYLQRIWNTLNGEDDLTKLASKSRDFADELKQEYNEAEADWQRIDKDLLKWLGSSIAKGVAAVGAGAIVNGKLGLAVGAAFGIEAVTKLLTARMERRSFRKKIPMSVLVDLEHHK